MLLGANGGLFDQQRIHVAAAEIAVQHDDAGNADLVTDLGGLLAGDDEVVGGGVAGAVLDMDEVAAHDAVVHLDDCLAGEGGLVLVDRGNGCRAFVGDGCVEPAQSDGGEEANKSNGSKVHENSCGE